MAPRLNWLPWDLEKILCTSLSWFEKVMVAPTWTIEWRGWKFNPLWWMVMDSPFLCSLIRILVFVSRKTSVLGLGGLPLISIFPLTWVVSLTFLEPSILWSEPSAFFSSFLIFGWFFAGAALVSLTDSAFFSCFGWLMGFLASASYLPKAVSIWTTKGFSYCLSSSIAFKKCGAADSNFFWIPRTIPRLKWASAKLGWMAIAFL